MKLEVGMKVRVRLYKQGELPNRWNLEEMPAFMGQVVTIDHIEDTSIHILEDDGNFWWREEDFEPVFKRVRIIL